jgi:hypothetical protein
VTATCKPLAGLKQDDPDADAQNKKADRMIFSERFAIVSASALGDLHLKPNALAFLDR